MNIRFPSMTHSHTKLARLLQYALVFFLLFQSWNGTMASSMGKGNNVCADTDVTMVMSSQSGHVMDMDSCDMTHTIQLCAQACAIVHALLPETLHYLPRIVTGHNPLPVQTLTSIVYPPLIPPPMLFA